MYIFFVFPLNRIIRFGVGGKVCIAIVHIKYYRRRFTVYCITDCYSNYWRAVYMYYKNIRQITVGLFLFKIFFHMNENFLKAPFP